MILPASLGCACRERGEEPATAALWGQRAQHQGGNAEEVRPRGEGAAPGPNVATRQPPAVLQWENGKMLPRQAPGCLRPSEGVRALEVSDS